MAATITALPTIIAHGTSNCNLSILNTYNLSKTLRYGRDIIKLNDDFNDDPFVPFTCLKRSFRSSALQEDCSILLLLMRQPRCDLKRIKDR